MFDRKSLLLVGLVCIVGISGCSQAAASAAEDATTPASTPEITAEPTEAVTAVVLNEDGLRNGSYAGIYEMPVQLIDGTFIGEPFVEGGASRPSVTFLSHALGDINADGVEDAAVVLVEDSGGSGSFVYLAAVINHDGAAQNASTTLLGDRVQVDELSIQDGAIILHTKLFTDTDPMCCPSIEKTLTYTLKEGTLVTDDQSSSESVPAELIGTWAWIAFRGTDELNNIGVSDSSLYTLEFKSDGTYQITADCNTGVGTFHAKSDSSLTIDPGAMTLMACAPESLDIAFLTHLGDVVTYVLQDGQLYLNLKMDAGNMVFDPQ